MNRLHAVFFQTAGIARDPLQGISTSYTRYTQHSSNAHY